MLEGIAAKKDLKLNSWVLSLARAPTENPEYLLNNIPEYDLPLQAISQIIKKRQGFIKLHKGNLDDFHGVKSPLLKGTWFHTLEKLINKININPQTHCEPVFIENKIQNRNEIFFESIDADWGIYEGFSDIQKPYHLYQQELLKNKKYIDFEIDRIRLLKKGIYNGVADSNDIGGGIYSYPEQLKNSHSIVYSSSIFSLIGITVPRGIEGETSIALNLTTQKIRKWLISNMSKYYKIEGHNSNHISHFSHQPVNKESFELSTKKIAACSHITSSS